MYGKNTCDAYSEVFALPDASMLTIAGPSRIITSTEGLAAAFSRGGIRSYNHPTRSHFFPSLILLICAGGQAWFSCGKNSSRSPARVWDAINNLENKEQSFLRNDTCSCVLDFCLTGGWLKRGRLFLFIGSVMGFV